MYSGAKDLDTSVKFKLGKQEVTWPTPIAIAPVGVQGRVTYPDDSGDLVTCSGPTEVGVPFIVSSVSSVSLERIAARIKEIKPESPAPWFQVYNSIVPDVTKSMIKRAKDSGYGVSAVQCKCKCSVHTGCSI